MVKNTGFYISPCPYGRSNYLIIQMQHDGVEEGAGSRGDLIGEFDPLQMGGPLHQPCGRLAIIVGGFLQREITGEIGDQQDTPVWPVYQAGEVGFAIDPGLGQGNHNRKRPREGLAGYIIQAKRSFAMMNSRLLGGLIPIVSKKFGPIALKELPKRSRGAVEHLG